MFVTEKALRYVHDDHGGTQAVDFNQWTGGCTRGIEEIQRVAARSLFRSYCCRICQDISHAKQQSLMPFMLCIHNVPVSFSP